MWQLPKAKVTRGWGQYHPRRIPCLRHRESVLYSRSYQLCCLRGDASPFTMTIPLQCCSNIMVTGAVVTSIIDQSWFNYEALVKSTTCCSSKHQFCNCYVQYCNKWHRFESILNYVRSVINSDIWCTDGIERRMAEDKAASHEEHFNK